MMKKISIGPYIIASAIIWGAVSIACAFILKGTGYYQEISLILNGGAAFHLMLLWVPLASQLKKNEKEENPENEIATS